MAVGQGQILDRAMPKRRRPRTPETKPTTAKAGVAVKQPQTFVSLVRSLPAPITSGGVQTGPAPSRPVLLGPRGRIQAIAQ